MRAGLVLLGIGLAVIWLVGLYDRSAIWLTWIELGLALVSLGVTAIPDEKGAWLRAVPVAIAGALCALWMAGLALHVAPSLDWWTLALAAGYALLGVVGGRPPAKAPGTDESVAAMMADVIPFEPRRHLL